jgi:hypothetical protein
VDWASGLLTAIGAGAGLGDTVAAGLGKLFIPFPMGLNSGGGEVLGPVYAGDTTGGAVYAERAAGLDGMGSERKTEGKATRLKVNFLKSAAGGVVSSRQILWLPRNDSRNVA